MPENSDPFIQDLTASQNSLYGNNLSLLPDRAAAQDVLLEIRITAWQKRADFTAWTSFFARASKNTYFHVLSHRRKMSRVRTHRSRDRVCRQSAARRRDGAQVLNDHVGHGDAIADAGHALRLVDELRIGPTWRSVVPMRMMNETHRISSRVHDCLMQHANRWVS